MHREVDDWAIPGPVLGTPCDARLTEETREVAREINHLYGAKKKKSWETTKALGELADVVFTICCIANREGMTCSKDGTL